VPTFGFGISPRGPRIWPSWPTTFIASGVAINDVEIHEAFLDLRREIVEADDVGAGFLRRLRLLALVNTAMRTFLPVPAGSTTEPRTV
jgi:hypothetical protein